MPREDLEIHEIGHQPFPAKRTKNVPANQHDGASRLRIRPSRGFNVRLRETGLLPDRLPGHLGHIGPYRLHELRRLFGDILMDQVRLDDGLQQPQDSRGKLPTRHGQVMPGKRRNVTHRRADRKQ